MIVLSGKTHLHLAAAAPEMARAQGCRPEALVFLCILFVTDANILAVEQADDRGQHRVAAELALLQVFFDPGAELGERLSELAAAVIFGCVLFRPVIGMIAILLAPARVLAGRLDVTVGVLAEPGVGVGGGKCDGIQPVDLVAVRDPLPLLVEILPVAAVPLSRVAGLAV